MSKKLDSFLIDIAEVYNKHDLEFDFHAEYVGLIKDRKDNKTLAVVVGDGLDYEIEL